jgi:hypothetical protein
MKNLILAASLLCNFALVASLRASDKSTLAENRDEYVEKAKVELDELGAKIDDLEIKSKESGSAVKANAQRKLKTLKARRKTAQKDFDKIKRASGKAWTELKAGVDKGIEEIKAGLAEIEKD